MWALKAGVRGQLCWRPAPQDLCPQAAQFSELQGLDLPAEKLGTGGNSGQRAAQGTTLSERNQAEVLATFSFKDPLWPRW